MKNTSNDRFDQMIDDAHLEYCQYALDVAEAYTFGDVVGMQSEVNILFKDPETFTLHTKDEFISLMVKDKVFAKRWGLEFEFETLSIEDRRSMVTQQMLDEAPFESEGINNLSHEECNELEIPRTKITLTCRLTNYE